VCICLSRQKEVKEEERARELKSSGVKEFKSFRIQELGKSEEVGWKACPRQAGKAAEEAHRIGKSKALLDFGRWVALQAEFCFDEAEDYREDDGG
jgi:hypothetical protein